jgi:predicted nucleotidyltransferase
MLPHLQQSHQVALRDALAWIPTIVEPVAIVATGSIVRGNAHAASDLDLVILHDQGWRRRVQRRFNDTPTELFFNSEAWLRDSVDREAAEGRPVLPHMLATGTMLFDPTGRMEALVRLARAILARGPDLDPDALLRDRYMAACQVEDALDLQHVDTPDARQLHAAAVDALVRHAYLSRNRFLPRRKERLSALADVDPTLAELLSEATAGPRDLALAALTNASLHLLGTTGFFEWDSGPQEGPPPV